MAVSLYDRRDGKDLGHIVEFRMGLDVGYRFANGFSLSLGIYQHSNTRLAKDNPGANSVFVTYAYDF